MGVPCTQAPVSETPKRVVVHPRRKVPGVHEARRAGRSSPPRAAGLLWEVPALTRGRFVRSAGNRVFRDL